MRFYLITIFFLIFGLNFVHAQRFGYIDTDFILNKMPEYKKAQEEIDRLSKLWEKEIQEVSKSIEGMYSALQAEQVLLTDEMKKERTELIRKKEAELNDEFVVPQKGLKKDMLELAFTNIDVQDTQETLFVKQCKDYLGVEKPISLIECFDISHLQGTNMVGSMSCFKHLKPYKKRYRKFNIKTVSGVDDFRAIKEIVYRRYKRLKDDVEQKNIDLYPDLIVIDGGAIQLDFAKQSLDELGLDIPLIGLAKKFEEIYLVGKKDPLRLDKKTVLMKTLISLRDEAHRFGITFHRQKRSKKAKE